MFEKVILLAALLSISVLNCKSIEPVTSSIFTSEKFISGVEPFLSSKTKSVIF